MAKDSSDNEKSAGLKVVPETQPLRLAPPDQPSAKEERKSLPPMASARVTPAETVTAEAHTKMVRDDELEWGGGARKTPLFGWFVLAGMILIGIGLWAVASMFSAQDGIEEVTEKKAALAQNVAEAEEDIKAIQQRMAQAASAYLGARTIEEKLVFARQPERVKPLMKDYYQDHRLTPLEFGGFESLVPFALDTLPFVLARVDTDEGLKILFMEQVADDRFLIDWETDVGYQPMEWEQFLQQKPKRAMAMRVWVSRDNFYAYEFRDEKKYQCYRLTDAKKQQHVFAYVERGSQLMHEIEKSVVGSQGDANPAGLIARIRYPGTGVSKRCVIIDEVLSNSWIYATPPADGTAPGS